MRKLIWVVVILAIILGAIYFIGDEPEAGGETQTTVQYFREKMIERGIQDIGMPIEGFDANLLIMAYPGLQAADFQGVQTAEGKYEVQNGQAVFVRDTQDMITSAEGMVSEEGYATLLSNVSKRLGKNISTEAQVEELLAQINTGERIKLKIGESGSFVGVKVAPTQVLEDSRCPANANCIQAGRIRVRVEIVSAMGTSTNVLEENKSITTEAEEVTLLYAEPQTEAGVKIEPADYVFTFEIKKRDIDRF
jgi:hypothetical protein